MDQTANLYKDLDRILVTQEEIRAAVRKLGQQITADYAGREPVLLGILKGAIVFFSDLMREIDLPVTTEFMAVSSYGAATKNHGVVRIVKDLDHDITGKDVLIVEDIVDSGVTLHYLKQHLTGRRVDLKADYFCFEIPDAFVVGYGLDYAEKYRNLPDIGVLAPALYS